MIKLEPKPVVSQLKRRFVEQICPLHPPTTVVIVVVPSAIVQMAIYGKEMIKLETKPVVPQLK